jgi:hypothetical protein
VQTMEVNVEYSIRTGIGLYIDSVGVFEECFVAIAMTR